MSSLKPLGGTLFMTGQPPVGFGARFYLDDAGLVQCHVRLDDSKQGPPGFAHGGSLIALLDETMGIAAWTSGHRVVAANLQFDLRKGVPLNTDIVIYGRVDRTEGRKVYTVGEIHLPDETLAVEGRGLFIIAPQLFEETEGRPTFIPPDGWQG